MRALGRLGRIGLRWVGDLASPGLEAMRQADAILDLSGGDSFTDLYGEKRFDTVSFPKWIALDLGAPLVLLPQTYGPFRDARLRAKAFEIIRGARAAWARDARSFDVLRGLLGDEFDPRRHRLGVDMAFGLEARARDGGLDPVVDRWHRERRGPVVGVNVSGLIWLSPERARSYGFRADYRAVTTTIVKRLLMVPDVHVVLIPHVIAPIGSYESDLEACLGVEAAVEGGERLHVLRPPYDACEIKHEIGRLDWFVGTRMHATIAALSSSVPAAAVAYSQKFLGIFERCGLGDEVIDPTQLDESESVERAMGAFHGREGARARLVAALPSIRSTLAEQLDDVVSVVLERRERAG
jgi:polysaccharide pyruvyl transferase WcaK-like protein